MDALLAPETLPTECVGETFAIGLVLHGDSSISLSIRTQRRTAPGTVIIEDITAAIGVAHFSSLDEALDFVHDAVIANKTRQEADCLRAM